MSDPPLPQTVVDATALSKEGYAYLEAGRLDKAARCLNQAVHLDPSNPLIHYRLGLLHSDSGRPSAALAEYDASLQLDNGFAKAHNNRGSVLQMLGRREEACTAFKQALQLDPYLAPPYINLGHLLEGSGRSDEACALYKQALARGLEEGLFRHHIAAASNATTEASPESWVRATFDNFAPNFDTHLESLSYTVPVQLAAMLLAKSAGPFDIVDLGCGTGLCGAAMREHVRHLTGVDLSERMLVEARRLEIYDELRVAGIRSWLETAPAANCDVVIAADVFIYIGALEEVFHHVHRILQLGGWFSLSVEECADAPFELRPTGRYAQSRDYVMALAGDRFAVAAERATAIRMEEGMPIGGRLYLLCKT